MRTNIKLALTVMILLSLGVIYAGAKSTLAGDQEFISIIRIGSLDSNKPKAPSSIRVECWIEDGEELWVGLQNAGNNVEVTLSSNGAANDYVYSLPGDSLNALPLPETTGQWTITIALENGDVYYGQFVI